GIVASWRREMSNLANCTFQYRKMKLIGKGNFGKVYRIHDPQLLGTFAAKEILKENFEDDAFRILYAEAEAMNAAQCPHVIQVRSAGENEKHIVIVMPY